MEKGQIITLTIEDMSNEGAGIGRDGLVVFVQGAVYGDRVRARLTKIKKNYAIAELVEIEEASPYRREKTCPHIDECGGCPFGRLTYEAQLELKSKQVRDKLTRLGGASLDNDNFKDIIPSEKQQAYRNKASLAVHGELVGFRARKSNRVVDCRECMLQHPIVMEMADALRAFLKETGCNGGDGGQDAIRGMTVKIAGPDESPEVMVIIHTKDLKPDKEGNVYCGFDYEELAYALDDACGGCLESMHVNDINVAGGRTITDTAGNLKFEISADSFYQVNHDQMIRLYDKVAEYALGNPEKGAEAPAVWDLYCGVGTIGLYLADRAGSVFGIEIVKQAVLDANRNAVINGIVNATYKCGKAEELLPKHLEDEKDMRSARPDVVILDPPRAGCKPELLGAVISAEPERIVYVSCDPATLARDIKILTDNKYELAEVTPVDMFPQTGHVESVVLLSKAAK